MVARAKVCQEHFLTCRELPGKGSAVTPQRGLGDRWLVLHPRGRDDVNPTGEEPNGRGGTSPEDALEPSLVLLDAFGRRRGRLEVLVAKWGKEDNILVRVQRRAAVQGVDKGPGSPHQLQEVDADGASGIDIHDAPPAGGKIPFWEAGSLLPCHAVERIAEPPLGRGAEIPRVPS